jgi:hypothetical protein
MRFFCFDRYCLEKKLKITKLKQPLQSVFILKGISNFLQASCIEETIPIEHYINDLFEMLFPHVCLPADQSTFKNYFLIKFFNKSCR